MNMTNALTEFASYWDLGFSIVSVASRPDAIQWPHGASHWRYELRTLHNDRVVSGFYSQGSAHTEAPTVSDVLESLALDADCHAQSVDVLEFANEFGYDLSTDESIERCRRTYAACGVIHADLTKLLGSTGVGALWEAWHIMNGADTM